IYINGLDIYAYDYVNYIKKIAAVLQDYKLFAFSVIDNVSSEKEPDRLQIERLFQQVSLSEKIAELSHGMDTVLNKAYDEDGTELSGGQGQKLAITRALYKKADLVILDEPTSSLDPLAEAEIYQHFNELVLSKTAIYISHRMSSSVFCDKVLVIDQGGVSDFAPHSQLMKKKNSLYYQLFSSQAKNYQL
ncbi:MAG: ABC transporter ATP-binding protein, partial [Bacilli bacterium]|nr:ABC transporter ATP-binding protein [Bacilli bacterium]